MIFGHWKIVGGLLIAAALSACSGTEGPQAPPMLADGACSQLRADLNSMDKRGVPGMIDARNNGKKYGPAQDAEINRYNQVLDQYLGGQCASEARYKQKAGIPMTPPPSGRQASAQNASMATGSLPRTQVKRRKPLNDDEDLGPSEKSAAADEQGASKPARRKSSSQSASKAKPASADSAAAPAATQVKADSGLPAAPAPSKADSGEKKE